ncbi:ABC transporter ATP-binding protein [Ramlibacter ginsenosidimutans]|uniref:ABC transporter ATP-binding protein n=1 Tax=Ramlibacter ginsenosidimutans TaxID=502333 RepID=A0A934WNV8_9BURK|nr:ABC transporter ATP-binding protein [Ramlibacter ginsenosidimutans]MBK6007953.1 ABC transporter ATP-binding protein [Ramlibacter ginsenosidimutans]
MFEGTESLHAPAPAAPEDSGAVLEIAQADAFYGKAQVLFGISLKIRRGQVVAVIGANGAGKSTTLNLVTGRVRPSSGRVLLNGQSIAGAPTEQIIARGVGCVPQRRRIFPTLTVLENLEVGGYVRRKDKAGLARTLEEVYTLFPVLKKKSHMMGGILSGGEQQMLAIGRGLMSDPSLLLLDEPSMGISPKLTTEMFADIRRIAATGRTVMVVEQNAYAALSIADYGYALENGAVVLQGEARRLIHDDYVRQTYLGA